MTNSLSDITLLIDVAFVAGLTIHVRASIHRIAEHVIDGGVGRGDPAQLMAGSEGRHDAQGMQRKSQMLRAEPYPDLACRAQFREFVEDGAEGTGDRFVGMKANLTLLLTPHQADWQGAAQFATRRFVADATVESSAQDVQFCFRHGAF